MLVPSPRLVLARFRMKYLVLVPRLVLGIYCLVVSGYYMVRYILLPNIQPV